MAEFKQVYGEQVNVWSVEVEDNKLVVSRNGEQRKYKVVESGEYVYRILKTQIQAMSGAEGLYKHLCDWGRDAAFKYDVFRTLNNIWEKVKPIKA